MHIVNAYNRDTESLGLEIGNSEDPQNTYSAIARGRLQNISVVGFKIGVKANANHFYIFAFKDIIIHSCKIDFECGDEGVKNNDSGENISFENCLFGSCYYGFKNNISSMNFTFNNCSFDYNTAGAIYMYQSTTVNLNHCHIEGCRNQDSDLSGIIGTSSTNAYCTVNIKDCRLVQANKDAKLINGANITASIDGLTESYLSNVISLRDADSFYLSDNSQITNYRTRTTLKMISPRWNKYVNKSLSNETAGNDIAAGGSTTFVKYQYKDSNTSSMSIVSEEDENCVSITAESNNLFNAEFYLDEFIPIDNPMQRVTASYLYKITEGTVSPTITFEYYNESKELISSKQWSGASGVNPLTEGEAWQKPVNCGYVENIPSNTKYVRIRFRYKATVYCSQLLLKQFHAEVR